MHTGNWWGKLWERHHLEDYRLEYIKKNLQDMRWEDADWIDLAQDRGKWRAFVNTVMKLRVP
jgi:hypothetical protein